MKLVKRIIYSLLGLLMVLTVGMVGLILYAEYSGKPFSFKSTSALEEAAYTEEDSRLVTEGEGDAAPVADTAPAEEAPAPAAETEPVPEAAQDPAADTTQAPPADATPADASASDATATYALNTESSIFHKMDCPLVADIASDNYTTMTGLKENVVARGYDPCGSCNP